jgi:hypothetical protein
MMFSRIAAILLELVQAGWWLWLFFPGWLYAVGLVSCDRLVEIED